MSANLRHLLIITLAALALRIFALEIASPIERLGDENYYVRTAVNMAEGQGHHYLGSRAWRPPAHSWVLSQFVDTHPTSRKGRILASTHTMLRVQVVLSTLVVPAIILLGWGLFGAKTGLLAGWFGALYPIAVAHSHTLWSENLFAFLVTTGMALGVWHAKKPRWELAVLAGLAFGFGTLTREMAGLVAVIFAGWWVYQADSHHRRRAFAHAALCLGIVFVIVAPWTFRNYKTFDRLVPVSTIGWFAIAEGNTFETEDILLLAGPQRKQFWGRYFTTRNELVSMDFARRHALTRIVEEQPTWLIDKLYRTTNWMFAPDSYLVLKIRQGSYGDLSLGFVRVLIVLSAGSYVLALLAAALGIAGSPGRRMPAALVMSAIVAVHVISNASPRFRIPWMPLVLVYASHAFLACPRISLKTTSSIVALTAVVLLLVVGAPFFIDTVSDVWISGVHAGPYHRGP
jgi:4-amino-4-deoxy-L-arabinose transferase-like glycosyltransferase